MLALRLSDEMEQRLEALAQRTGRTKTFYVREAIEAHLDELENFYLAEERLRPFRDPHLKADSADRAALVDTLQRLWMQGEASGAAIDGNFDAADIARRGGERLAEARRDD